MSTVDTSTWNPDANLNTEIEGIPLNADASIQQTWQALRVLMAAVKGDGDAIKSMIDVMQGATASADGASGLAPAPQAGDQNKVLKGDGTWGTIDAGDVSVAWEDIEDKPSSFTPSSHAHGSITNDGKIGSTANLPLITTTSGKVATGSFGTTANTFCQGNDSRLSDARTPTAHAHGNITNDGKLDAASRVVVTDGSKAIGASSITTTKLGYLTDVTANIQGQIDGKADKATTLSDYGITDAKIANGTITIGSSTITPLTSGSTLDATKLSGMASIDTTGNADTATKLQTARSISAGNLEFQGSANFDGSGSIALNVTNHRSIVTVGNTNNYSFHRIAYISTLTGNYADRGITFLVSKDFSGGGWGICRIILRTNNATGGQTATCNVQWLVRSGEISADSIQAGFCNTANASYIDVFYKSAWAYHSAVCRVLAHSNSRTSVGRGFTVVSASTEASSTTATDPKTSVESYKTIADAGTALHSQAYTDIIAASDVGVTGQAGKLSTSRTISLTGDVSGSAAFDGSANASIAATVADDSHNHVISNVDGLQTALDGKAADSGVVHSSGNETVAGEKDFSGIVRINNMISTASGNTELQLRSTDNYKNGSYIVLYNQTDGSRPGYFRLNARTSSSAAIVLEGKPDGTLTWNGQSVQTTSDERLKTPLAAVPDEVLDAWGDVDWGQFRFLDAVDRKGENARLHLGLVAQKVKAAFEERGLDACAYGILCHETADATENAPATDLWMVRYAEAQAMESAYQRRRADRLESRLNVLEARLGAAGL